MKLIRDLGLKFPTEKSKSKRRYGLYECDMCKTHFEAISYDVKRRKQTTCYMCKNITHGQTIGRKKDVLYRAWDNMKSRCYQSSYIEFSRYGGRGIKICDEWKNDSIKFIKWSKNNGWKKGLSLDRIDNDGNYEPSNCRWATREMQAQNSKLLRSTNKSGYRGVIIKGKKWKMQIHHNGEYVFGQLRSNKKHAALDYDIFVLRNGKLNPLNFLKRKVNVKAS